MSDKPDFDKLRAERDAAINKLIDAVCADRGWERENIGVHVSGAGECYCACPDGPCEHSFKGWREAEDGCGGETVCQKCGMGAMSHSLRCGP
ncbi:hypothetical protein [Methylocystis sp. S23]